MSDDDLIARLHLPWPKNESVEEVTLPAWVLELTAEAADRVEALVKELATSNEVGRAFEEDAGQQRARAERLEAALREIASGKFSGQLLMSNPPKDPAADFARAALTTEERK